ncbi:D-inositol-3-phosphate glycosyltransferase [subsurface metagenome]
MRKSKLPRVTTIYRKPKIMVFVHTMETGGLQCMLLNTLKYLKDDFDFYLVVFKKVNSLLEKECKNYVKNFFVLNENVFSLKLNDKCVEKIQNLIEEVSPDLIESHLFFIDLQIREAAKKSNFKNIIIYQHGFGNGWDKNMQNLELKYLAYTRRYICVSDWNKKTLITVGISEDRITVIYNGIDKQLFELNDHISKEFSSNLFQIGFIGRIEPSKNPLLLPKIVKRLIKTFRLKNFKFHIVGKGSLERLLKDRIKSKSLQKYFEFHGEIPYYKITEIYRRIHLLLLTSQNESLPNVIIEALVNEIPVIAPSIGGISEVIEDETTGFLITSTDKYAEAISNLIRYPSIYNRVVESIKKHKERYYEKFSMEKYVNKRREIWMKCM